MRVIVDTSVWSFAFRRRAKSLSRPERALTLLLRDLIVAGDPISPGVVRQELLTGIRDPSTFDALRNRLHDFDDLPPEIDDYERAAEFGNVCTRAGIAATTVDMLICAMAASRGLPILTTDDDFKLYARHLPIKLHPHSG